MNTHTKLKHDTSRNCAWAHGSLGKTRTTRLFTTPTTNTIPNQMIENHQPESIREIVYSNFTQNVLNCNAIRQRWRTSTKEPGVSTTQANHNNKHKSELLTETILAGIENAKHVARKKTAWAHAEMETSEYTVSITRNTDDADR